MYQVQATDETVDQNVATTMASADARQLAKTGGQAGVTANGTAATAGFCSLVRSPDCATEETIDTPLTIVKSNPTCISVAILRAEIPQNSLNGLCVYLTSRPKCLTDYSLRKGDAGKVSI